jgi:hypothetical protein
MEDERELGWLRLTDKSQLVLTTGHVFQHQDYGIFGESRAIIPRKAITTFRLSLQRSRGALVLGLILFLASLAMIVANQMHQPEGITFDTRLFAVSPSTLSWIQYGLLIAGLALIALFWFHKKNEIQIVGGTGNIGGTPVNYEDAEEFCLLLMGAGKKAAPTAANVEPEPENSPKTTDPDWRL